MSGNLILSRCLWLTMRKLKGTITVMFWEAKEGKPSLIDLPHQLL